ncbi:MAG TPA: AEC family transporter [Stellaceae bacterium]|nr:AEC family transporter [Stellaceae bacterium]
MLHILLATLAPLSAVIGLGFLWVRLGRPFDGATLGQLAADIGMPCLALSTLAQAEISVAAFMASAVAAFACLTALAAAGAVALSLARLRLRTYLPAVTWGNSGFLGIPLSLYAFGHRALGYAVAFSAVSLVFNSAFSQAMAVGSVRIGVLARSPLLYGVALGVVAQILGVRLPDWIGNGVALLGGIAIPLMLMMIGASIARIRAVSLGRAFVFSWLRMAGGGGIGLSVAACFGLSPIARHVLVLQCAMPVAVLSYVFAQRWNNNPEEVASLVAVSTWSAAVSVPLMLGLMLGTAAH